MAVHAQVGTRVFYFVLFFLLSLLLLRSVRRIVRPTGTQEIGYVRERGRIPAAAVQVVRLDQDKVSGVAAGRGELSESITPTDHLI